MTIVSRHDHHAWFCFLRLPVLGRVLPELVPHCNDGNQHEQHAQEEHYRIHTSWLLGFLFSRG